MEGGPSHIFCSWLGARSYNHRRHCNFGRYARALVPCPTCPSLPLYTSYGHEWHPQWRQVHGRGLPDGHGAASPAQNGDCRVALSRARGGGAGDLARASPFLADAKPARLRCAPSSAKRCAAQAPAAVSGHTQRWARKHQPQCSRSTFVRGSNSKSTFAWVQAARSPGKLSRDGRPPL